MIPKDNHYIQPCVYDSGIWVTLLCPHSHIESKKIILKDDKYIKYENRQGLFAFVGEDNNEN